VLQVNPFEKEWLKGDELNRLSAAINGDLVLKHLWPGWATARLAAALGPLTKVTCSTMEFEQKSMSTKQVMFGPQNGVILPSARSAYHGCY
jgi:hypothetical protein